MAGGGAPPGFKLVRSLLGSRSRDNAFALGIHRFSVLALTFIAYACYHASRKPPSIVKSVLDPKMPNTTVALLPCYSSQPWPLGRVFVPDDDDEKIEKGWAPFDGPGGTAKLGEIDLAFLAFYSIGMFVAGHLGDHVDLRLFLAGGMVASGFFVSLFGMGYFWGFHCFWYFLIVQMFAGLFQATGWPSVVAVVGNWFGGRKRGLIMGVWNAHTSVGNISGSLLAASVLQYGWGWSFLLPGGLIVAGGLLIYLFLVPYPEDVGLPCSRSSAGKSEVASTADVEIGKDAGALIGGGSQMGTPRNRSAIGIGKACKIPGVIPYAACLFFSKLVAYTFLYWLPFYLSQTAIGGEYMSVKSAGNLSTLFDVGGIIGGVLAGYISDQLNARAITAATFMYLAIPSLYAYQKYGGTSKSVNVMLMMVAGLFVNGPYALITTAVSADLGTHRSLREDSRALATVTAIIDGTGSLGAALGPLLTGFISSKGWHLVFIMLMVGAAMAGALLSFLIKTEILHMIHQWQRPSGGDKDSVTEPLVGQSN